MGNEEKESYVLRKYPIMLNAYQMGTLSGLCIKALATCRNSSKEERLYNEILSAIEREATRWGDDNSHEIVEGALDAMPVNLNAYGEKKEKE